MRKSCPCCNTLRVSYLDMHFAGKGSDFLQPPNQLKSLKSKYYWSICFGGVFSQNVFFPRGLGKEPPKMGSASGLLCLSGRVSFRKEGFLFRFTCWWEVCHFLFYVVLPLTLFLIAIVSCHTVLKTIWGRVPPKCFLSEPGPYRSFGHINTTKQNGISRRIQWDQSRGLKPRFPKNTFDMFNCCSFFGGVKWV